MSGGIQPAVIRLPSRRRRRETPPNQPSLIALEAELRTIEIAIGALAARKKGVLSAYRRVLKQSLAVMSILLLLVGSSTGRHHCRTFRLHPGVAPQGLIICFSRRLGPSRSPS
jgi:hypothetical protein